MYFFFLDILHFSLLVLCSIFVHIFLVVGVCLCMHITYSVYIYSKQLMIELKVELFIYNRYEFDLTTIILPRTQIRIQCTMVIFGISYDCNSIFVQFQPYTHYNMISLLSVEIFSSTLTHTHIYICTFFINESYADSRRLLSFLLFFPCCL